MKHIVRSREQLVPACARMEVAQASRARVESFRFIKADHAVASIWTCMLPLDTGNTPAVGSTAYLAENWERQVARMRRSVWPAEKREGKK